MKLIQCHCWAKLMAGIARKKVPVPLEAEGFLIRMSEDILFYSSLLGCTGLCLYVLIKQSRCLSMPRFSVALLAEIYSGAFYNISLSETTNNPIVCGENRRL